MFIVFAVLCFVQWDCYIVNAHLISLSYRNIIKSILYHGPSIPKYIYIYYDRHYSLLGNQFCNLTSNEQLPAFQVSPRLPLTSCYSPHMSTDLDLVLAPLRDVSTGLRPARYLSSHWPRDHRLPSLSLSLFLGPGYRFNIISRGFLVC